MKKHRLPIGVQTLQEIRGSDSGSVSSYRCCGSFTARPGVGWWFSWTSTTNRYRIRCSQSNPTATAAPPKPRQHVPTGISCVDSMRRSNSLSAFDVDHISTEALLFQTGYLTIGGEIPVGVRTQYRLAYPNLEVRQSLNDHLLRCLDPSTTRIYENQSRLHELLETHDTASLERLFHAFWGGVKRLLLYCQSWRQLNEHSSHHHPKPPTNITTSKAPTTETPTTTKPHARLLTHITPKQDVTGEKIDYLLNYRYE